MNALTRIGQFFTPAIWPVIFCVYAWALILKVIA